VRNALGGRRDAPHRIESKALLDAFRIPCAPLALPPPRKRVGGATRGFPVAMKIDSPDITHKSDVDGVR
jgi:acetyltransferase